MAIKRPSASYSIARARNDLARIVHGVERGEPAELTRRGKAVAVLISAPDYDRLEGVCGFWQALEVFRSSRGFEPIVDPAAVFRGTRSRERGRPVKL